MAVIGEMQTFAATVPPGWTLISANWNFGAFAGNFIADYQPNQATAVVVPVTSFSSPSLNMYYIEPADVQCSVDIEYIDSDGNQGSETMNGEDDYLAPTVDDEECGGIGAWQVVLGQGSNIDLLSLGIGEEFGCEIEATVTLPTDAYGDGAGELAFVQLVSGSLTYIPFNGNPIQLQIPGGVLDNTFPYDPPGAAASGQTLTVTMNDSPSYWLPRNGCASVSVDLTFTTSLIYLPTSAGLVTTWMQLGTFTWSATCTANKPAPGEDWLLMPDNTANYGGFVPGYGNPLWATNIQTYQQAFLQQIQQAFGPPPFAGRLSPPRRGGVVLPPVRAGVAAPLARRRKGPVLMVGGR